MALHAKAKAEAGYCFYALYDKISREDILSFAYAQCRSNKGGAGVGGQDFTDIEAYGGGQGRWTGHPAGFTTLTAAGKFVHAPVRAGVEEARVGAKPWQSHRHL